MYLQAGALMGLELEGAEDALARLDRLIALFDDIATVKKIFLPAAEEARDRAKAIVHRHTGELEEHIFAAEGAPEIPNVIAGVDVTQVPYAHIVEWGGPERAAHPYMRPAADEVEGKLAELVAPELLALIQGVL
jgi:HK97 gp10 family phage protein